MYAMNNLHCSIADYELSQIEADAHGHYIIAMLCLLAVSEEGLREIELRTILADEHNLLPHSIKRTSKVGLHFSTFTRLH